MRKNLKIQLTIPLLAASLVAGKTAFATKQVNVPEAVRAAADSCKDDLVNAATLDLVESVGFCREFFDSNTCRYWYQAVVAPATAYATKTAFGKANAFLQQHSAEIANRMGFNIASQGHEFWKQTYVNPEGASGHLAPQGTDQQGRPITRGQAEQIKVIKAKEAGLVVEVDPSKQTQAQMLDQIKKAAAAAPAGQQVIVVRKDGKLPPNIKAQPGFAIDITNFKLSELHALGATTTVNNNLLPFTALVEKLNQMQLSGQHLDKQAKLDNLMNYWHEDYRARNFGELRKSIDPDVLKTLMDNRTELIKGNNSVIEKYPKAQALLKSNAEVMRMLKYDVPFEQLADDIKAQTMKDVKFVVSKYNSTTAKFLGIKNAILLGSLRSPDFDVRRNARGILMKRAGVGLGGLALAFEPVIRPALRTLRCELTSESSNPEEKFIEYADCEKKVVKLEIGQNVSKFLSLDPKEQSDLLKTHQRICQFYTDLAERLFSRHSTELEIAKALLKRSPRIVKDEDSGLPSIQFQDNVEVLEQQEKTTVLTLDLLEKIVIERNGLGQVMKLSIAFNQSAQAPKFIFNRLPTILGQNQRELDKSDAQKSEVAMNGFLLSFVDGNGKTHRLTSEQMQTILESEDPAYSDKDDVLFFVGQKLSNYIPLAHEAAKATSTTYTLAQLPKNRALLVSAIRLFKSINALQGQIEADSRASIEPGNLRDEAFSTGISP